MFHTACLNKKLSLEEYTTIDSILPKFSKSFLHKNISNESSDCRHNFRRYAFTNFKIDGIRMYLTKMTIYIKDIKGTITRSYLHLIINPKAILHKDYISVTNESEAIIALRKIDKLFLEMGIGITCADFNTSRIDCCLNLRFYDDYGRPSDTRAREYLELQQRGIVPAGFVLGKSFSEAGKRYVPYKNSLVYRSRGNSVVINIYNKYEQLKSKYIENPKYKKKVIEKIMKNNNDTNADEEYVDEYFDNESLRLLDEENNIKLSLNDTVGIIRFEVQCNYRKLYYTKNSKKWDFDSLSIYNFISDEFTTTVLQDYIGIISTSGDYYTLEEARSRVLNSNVCLTKTKNGLLALLTQASRQMSWSATAKRLSENPIIEYKGTSHIFTPGKIDYALGLLDKLGVNIVTIPKDWSSDYFRSPINLINDAIRNNSASQAYDIVD